MSQEQPLPIPDELFPGGRIRQRNGKTLRNFLKGLQRPLANPVDEWQLKLFDQLEAMLAVLRYKIRYETLFSKETLESLGITRGEDLNIDDCLSIDMEPRYFVPAPERDTSESTSSEEYEAISENTPNHPDADQRVCPYAVTTEQFAVTPSVSSSFGTLYNWGLDTYGMKTALSINARERERAQLTLRISSHRLFSRVHGILDYFYYPTHKQSVYQHYADVGLVLGKLGPHCHNRDKNIAHFIATIEDSVIPDDRLRGGELMCILTLLSRRLVEDYWQDHYIFPLLALSFHPGGCRILQVEASNGLLRIRTSRFLHLSSKDKEIPADTEILLRWFYAIPIGDTRFSSDMFDIHDIDKKQHGRDLGPAGTLPIEVPSLSELRIS